MTPSRSLRLHVEIGSAVMSARIMENQLLRLLVADRDLHKRDCMAALQTTGGVEISTGGVRRGHWAWTGRDFVFTPDNASHRAIHVDTAVEALIATRAMVHSDWQD